MPASALRDPASGQVIGAIGILRDMRELDKARAYDAGPGIPAHSLSTIFEPRTRLVPAAPRNGSRRTPGDAGLGLSIARDIVAAHGGRIWAESEPGDGASFSVVLPLQARRRRRAGSRNRER